VIIQVFAIAFLVSFIGSIPPGTINITGMQLSIQGHRRAAFYFVLGASITELIYAGITVRFQIYLSSKPEFTVFFDVISSLVLLSLGVVNLFAKNQTKKLVDKSNTLSAQNGFGRGVVLSLLNPLTIPFWLMVTAFLQNQSWVQLDETGYWVYILGIAAGTFLLLLSVNNIGVRFAHLASNSFLVYRLPGILFLLMGAVGLFNYFF
jgi:threonine/homoserine/homoserine lactone efflux protein